MIDAPHSSGTTHRFRTTTAESSKATPKRSQNVCLRLIGCVHSSRDVRIADEAKNKQEPHCHQTSPGMSHRANAKAVMTATETNCFVVIGFMAGRAS